MQSDFVFKELDEQPCMEFVGDFEGKYKSEIDPWEQSGRTGVRAEYYAYSRRKLLSRLSERIGEGALGLEVGCGFGYLTEMLARRFEMTGMDVSPTALKRADVLHPGPTYIHADLIGENFKWDPAVRVPSAFHFVILAQCWWYILHDWERALRNCLSCLESGGFFVLHQAFLKDQKYGKGIANGFGGALRLLSSCQGLRLVEASYEDSGQLCYYDGLLMFRDVSSL